MLGAFVKNEAEEKLGIALVFLFPAGFFVVKGWSTTIALLIFVLVVVSILINPRKFFSEKPSEFWFVVLILVVPFVSELVAQILRSKVVPSQLDGPARFLIAAAIFVYASNKNAGVFLLSRFCAGAVPAILIAGLQVYLYREHWWGDRAATYFVDPITLGCYAVILYFLGMQWILSAKFGKSLKWILSICMFVAMAYTVIFTQARTAWVAFLFVFIFWAFLNLPLRAAFFLIGAVILGCFLVTQNPIVAGRLDLAFSDLERYLAGDYQDSSVGIRLALIHLDLHLLRENLFVGLGDGVLPPFPVLRDSFPYITEQLYLNKLLGGSHVEILAQLVRKGILLGSITVVSLFLFPVIYAFSCKSPIVFSVQARKTVFVSVLALFICGLGIQVFNLKMTSSFYAVFLGLSAACLYGCRVRASLGSNLVQ